STTRWTLSPRTTESLSTVAAGKATGHGGAPAPRHDDPQESGRSSTGRTVDGGDPTCAAEDTERSDPPWRSDRSDTPRRLPARTAAVGAGRVRAAPTGPERRLWL